MNVKKELLVVWVGADIMWDTVRALDPKGLKRVSSGAQVAFVDADELDNDGQRLQQLRACFTCPTVLHCDAARAPELAPLLQDLDELSVAGETPVIVLHRLRLAAVRHQPVGDVAVTVSAGCATATGEMKVADFVRQADEALYAAKARGRDRSLHYDTLHREALAEDRDMTVQAFENHTRVIAERIAEVIAHRGHRMYKELRKQADVDALTQLFSRRYFDRRLDFEFETIFAPLITGDFALGFCNVEALAE